MDTHLRKALLTVLSAVALISVTVACKTRTQTVHTGQAIVLSDTFFSAGGSDTVRFGRLHRGEKAVKQIVFRNRSSRPILITSYSTTCGCASLEYDAQPILHSCEMPASITFDSRGEYGWQMKLLTLHIAGAAEPLKIYVEAEVEQ